MRRRWIVAGRHRANSGHLARRGRVVGLVAAQIVALAVAMAPTANAVDEIVEPTTTEGYVELARRFLPREEAQALLTERYILLSPSGRETFKRRNARTRHVEYQAFAICYYRAVEGGVRNDLAAFRCYDKFVRKYLP